ncbi:unnamed protein product [Absidia cylindrospora]
MPPNNNNKQGKDAVVMIKYAWKRVTPETIKNCFIHTGLFQYTLDTGRIDRLANDERTKDDDAITVSLQVIGQTYTNGANNADDNADDLEINGSDERMVWYFDEKLKVVHMMYICDLNAMSITKMKMKGMNVKNKLFRSQHHQQDIKIMQVH